VTSCHILAFQASVTSPQALCARISWGPKKFTKNISVFQSKLENDTKILGTSHCWAKKFLGAKNVENFRPNLVHFCYRFSLKPSTLAPRPHSACSYISRVLLPFRRSPHMQGGTCLCVLSDRGRSIQHRVSYDSTLVKCWRGGVVAGNKGRVVTWMDAISQARGWAPYALFFCCFCSTKMQYSFCLQMKSKGGVQASLLLPLLRAL